MDLVSAHQLGLIALKIPELSIHKTPMHNRYEWSYRCTGSEEKCFNSPFEALLDFAATQAALIDEVAEADEVDDLIDSYYE